MYTITVQGNTPEELMENLNKITVAPAPAPAVTPMVAPMVALDPAPAVTPAVTPTVAPANPVPIADAPSCTVEDLAKAGATLAQEGKMEQALALLAKYGVPTVHQLKPDQYGAFATELRGLGAQI